MSSITKKEATFILILLSLIIPIYLLGLRGVLVFPKEFSFGIISINLYGVSLLLGIYISAFLFDKDKSKFKEIKKINTYDALLWIIVPAIIFARLWHVVTDYELYSQDLLAIFSVWNGGLGIFGGIVGGILGAKLYTARLKVKLLPSLALVSVFLPLGQVIGRFGNFFNRELYGYETNLPWRFYLSELGKSFHPSFAYEQVGNLLLFFFLLIAYRKNGINNYLIGIYLCGYAIVRFLTDFSRTEERILRNLTTAQLVSAMIILIVGAYFVKLRLIRKQ
jgi:phosphatidylglycerol:prolipoprotein diacylglycerol transferase